ncbi:hypothetical protein EPI10_023775 [Gossypium australe]|uniref:Uncharacterized protein n=1 Tax=Gossypium australe TaxID=47621 RepID=A0A5B6VX39_9ROSI|nr:hypothetical protein EPI10_023775 [Gossypium australe]
MSCQLQSTFIVVLNSSCQPEVGDFGSKVNIQENVTALQILMNIRRIYIVMQIVECISYIVCNLNSLLPRKKTSPFITFTAASSPWKEPRKTDPLILLDSLKFPVAAFKSSNL